VTRRHPDAPPLRGIVLVRLMTLFRRWCDWRKKSDEWGHTGKLQPH
jgi:hypothetical protein